VLAFRKSLPSKVLPPTVFWIGIFSIALLLWVEHISERLHMYEALVDTVKDVQILTSKYHLQLEEVLSGVTSVDMEKDLATVDKAIILIDGTLVAGGQDNLRRFLPFQDTKLRSRAYAIKQHLIKLKACGLERLQRGDTSGSGSLIEQEFHAVYKDCHRILEEMENILEKEEDDNQGKSKRLFLGIMVIWPIILFAAIGGLWSRERKQKCAEEALCRSNEQLLAQTEELTCHRENLAELVIKRTKELTIASEQVKEEMTERLQVCEMLKTRELQVRELSTNLLSAQEAERKRISMELHDELGQALTAMKFRVRIMERGLQDDQGALREECEKLLESMNNVIEDVRRLSLALSPTVLEDLGLTSALRWLISNFSEISGTTVISDIIDIDHCFAQKQWVTIYRVMQEALTNIGKHAHAEKVFIFLRHEEHTVVFYVEDDGKGFDPRWAEEKDALGSGFGLTTMTERTQLMGGDFELWSQEGKGTRITVRIPV
jgi:signal transduction histidine kinase